MSHLERTNVGMPNSIHRIHLLYSKWHLIRVGLSIMPGSDGIHHDNTIQIRHPTLP